MNKIFLFLFFWSFKAEAHVKWFSDYDFQHPPVNFQQLNTPTFWGLFLLSVVSLPIFVWLDKIAEKSYLYRKTNQFLDQYENNGPLIMRVTMGAVLLMSWQSNTIIAPEIAIPSLTWGWIQFAMALCLLLRQTVFITGVGIIAFYILGISMHGFFHMLDYVIYPAAGLYLIFSHLKNERYRNYDLPALYSGLGFSLCWVAFEKLLYPGWGYEVLGKAPALAMGLPQNFFLLASAFIEFTLGFLLIICLLHRPLAAIITLVFFITTTYFGKTEVMGHLIIHGALLVFIVRGPGHYYQAPIRWFKPAWARSLFAAATFILFFWLAFIPYQQMAQETYAQALKRSAFFEEKHVLPPDITPPTVKIEAFKDPMGGWNIHLITTNYKFLPLGDEVKDGVVQGHAHLLTNGQFIGMGYGEWFFANLPPGKNDLKVILSSPKHKAYYHNNKTIEDSTTVVEDRMPAEGMHHR